MNRTTKILIGAVVLALALVLLWLGYRNRGGREYAAPSTDATSTATSTLDASTTPYQPSLGGKG
jgi:hypothetical protein